GNADLLEKLPVILFEKSASLHHLASFTRRSIMCSCDDLAMTAARQDRYCGRTGADSTLGRVEQVVPHSITKKSRIGVRSRAVYDFCPLQQFKSCRLAARGNKEIVHGGS